MTHRRTKAAFIEPMLLLRKEKLPEGPDWLYEIKLDGYRALAIKTAHKVRLRSRNDTDFSPRYPRIVQALAPLPAETVIDGEVVALESLPSTLSRITTHLPLRSCGHPISTSGIRGSSGCGMIRKPGRPGTLWLPLAAIH
jgi:ATP dependent DNA ligase domain